MVSTREDWFVLHKDNWQIGDNVEFPSHVLHVREVGRQMVDFIINHFEATVNIPPTAQELRPTL